MDFGADLFSVFDEKVEEEITETEEEVANKKRPLQPDDITFENEAKSKKSQRV